MSDLIGLIMVAAAVLWVWRERRRGTPGLPRPVSAPEAAAAAWLVGRSPPPPPPRLTPLAPIVRTPPRLTAERTDGVADGLTGAPLDPRRPLWRCTSCRTCYDDASCETLRAETDGACLACGGRSLARFTPSSGPPPGRGDGPVTLTVSVRWLGPAAEPGFFVAVLEDAPWRQALKLIFPPTFSRQPGADRFIAGLAGRQLTVSGHLAVAGALGPRIVVTDRAMLRDISPAPATPTSPRTRERR